MFVSEQIISYYHKTLAWSILPIYTVRARHMARISYLSKGVCMKLLALAVPMLALSRSYMSDPADGSAPAVVPVPDAPTKESLIKRLESLIEADYDSVKTLAHDWLTDLEDFFGHKGNDATSAVSGDAPAATGDAGNGAPSATAGQTPAPSSDVS